jgi:hypothetical protein
MVHETTRLKDDATGWAHKLQELELDLKLQLDLKKNQDVEATGLSRRAARDNKLARPLPLPSMSGSGGAETIIGPAQSAH